MLHFIWVNYDIYELYINKVIIYFKIVILTSSIIHLYTQCHNFKILIVFPKPYFKVIEDKNIVLLLISEIIKIC